jgi:hypothetical protein
MKFTPGSRSFDNLAQDVSADFVGLGEREVKIISDSKPASQCTEVDQSRERKNIIARYGAGWQENIKGERRSIIAGIVRDGEIAEATAGLLEPQINFFEECKGAYVTIRYAWQINTFFNGRPARTLTVPKQRKLLCGKAPVVGWLCK